MCRPIARCCSSIAYLACCPCRTTASLVSSTCSLVASVCRAADRAIDAVAQTILASPGFICRKTFSALAFPFRDKTNDNVSLAVWACGTSLAYHSLAEALPLLMKSSILPAAELPLHLSSIPFIFTGIRTINYIRLNGIKNLNIKSHAIRDFIVLEAAALLGTGIKLHQMGYFPLHMGR